MPAQHFNLANVEFDTGHRTATRDSEIVLLTPTEWKLLARLAEDVGRLVLSTDLLTSVWGANRSDDIAYLRVWISRLRRKLEPTLGEPALIKTMQGIGYMLDARPAG